MKTVFIYAAALCVLLAGCSKNTNTAPTTPAANNLNNDNIAVPAIGAKIDNKQWRSASRTSSSATPYIASFNGGLLQIKGYGSFTDSTSGSAVDDQLAIYIDGLTDTGRYPLSLTNYVVYNQQSASPLYFSSQISNSGYIYISSLSATEVSGRFECVVENTNGAATMQIKDGSFNNIVFQ